MITPLTYPPAGLPTPFSLRDLEQHLTQRIPIGFGTCASRLAETSLQHWIRRRIVRPSSRRCPGYGIPLYVRSWR